jgi:hypothetical protein
MGACNLNSIQLNLMKSKFNWIQLTKKGGMQIYEQAIWKICSLLSSSMTMVLEKVKQLQKKCLSIPFRFQTEIYFSTVKQLPSET